MAESQHSTPRCQGNTNWRAHCWHFPSGFWGVPTDPPPYDLVCCDCGDEATTRSFNRPAGTHGPFRKGRPFEARQHGFVPVFKVLP